MTDIFQELDSKRISNAKRISSQRHVSLGVE